MFHFAGLLDLEGKIIYINLPALEAVGCRLEDVRGQYFWDSPWFQVNELSGHQQREFVQSALAGQFVREDLEVFGKNQGREKIITDYSLKPMFDGEGDVAFILAEGRDITDKKNLEREVDQKNQRLINLLEEYEELSRNQKNFFSNLSHELKTPLSLILGNTDILMSRLGENDDPMELSSIRTNALSMLYLVDEMLELAKIDAGKAMMNFELCDLREIVQTVLSNFYSYAKSRSIQITLHAAPTVRVTVDVSKVRQIVFNLVGNAIRVVPANGLIECDVSRSQDVVVVAISDNGPGIPIHLKNTLFDRFQTGNHQRSGYHAGSGLGLAIVKEYCELHGGSIRVEDVQPSGTRFEIHLPVGEDIIHGDDLVYTVESIIQGDQVILPPDIADPIKDNKVLAPQQLTTDGSYVLLAEDNDGVAEMLLRVLSSSYQVVVVSNGQAALTTLRQARPLLLITDLMMPGMDGYELIREIKKSSELQDVPILALSANKNEQARIDLLSGYVDDYVTKPFFIPELLSRVRNIIELHKAKLSIREELSTHNNDLISLIRELIEARSNLQNVLDEQKEIQYRMNAIFNNSCVGIAVIDSNLDVVDANPFFSQVLGYQDDEMTGMSVFDLSATEDVSSHLFRFGELLEFDSSSNHYEMRFISKSGTEVWVNSSISVVPASVSAPVLLVGIFEDITEKKHIRESLMLSRKEIERFSRISIVNELASSIVHEINQPLSAIVSNVHACDLWLNGERANPEHVNRSLGLIRRDADRAVELISSIRNFVKSSSLELHFTLASELLKDVARIVSYEAQAAGIELEFDIVKDHQIYADPVSLKQVFVNLILNAIQALEGCYECTAGKILVRCDASDGFVNMSVEDNGPGLAFPLIDNLFEPFYSNKKDGLGFGLSICRGILESHRSSLDYEPLMPRGARFFFRVVGKIT
ncbi:ATP-binding protein [Candidatus Thalassolituus haligoni]